MAAIEVRRSPEGFRDSLRSYRILLDDQEVGRLRPGERTRLEIEPGTHDLQMAIDQKRSATFEVSGDTDDVYYFVCGSREPLTFDTQARGLAAIFDLMKRADDTWLYLELDDEP